MRRGGISYPFDDAWRERVERALNERGWTRTELADRIKANKSTVSEILNGTVSRSPYVADIHAALGWTPPQPPLADPDTQQMLDMWARLDAMQKGKLLGRAEAMLDDAEKKPGAAREPNPPDGIPRKKKP